jgi:hypothetical protein
MTEPSEPTEPFDPARYRALPRLSPTTALALGHSLRANMPVLASERVQRAASHLAAHLDALERALEGGSAENRELALREAELDGYLDGLWYALHERLVAWQVYDSPGLQQIVAATAATQVDYERCRRRAKRARELQLALFGHEGPEFVRHGYRTQALEMARRLALIAERQWAKDLDKLAGRELLPALREGQVVYEAMVAARTARGTTLSVRRASHEVQWQISLYVVHVLSMHDPSMPASEQLVRSALQPVLRLRRTGVDAQQSESGEWTYDAAR